MQCLQQQQKHLGIFFKKLILKDIKILLFEKKKKEIEIFNE
jgi:hypothetical protein